MSHVPLLSDYDEPETLSYQITLFGPIGADVRHLGTVVSLRVFARHLQIHDTFRMVETQPKIEEASDFIKLIGRTLFWLVIRFILTNDVLYQLSYSGVPARRVPSFSARE